MGRYLITGVSRGIGAELHRQLAAAGHQVFGIIRASTPDPESLGLAGYGVAELSEAAGLGEALAPFAADLGPLDGLIHSAGIVRGGTLEQTSANDFAEQFTINVTAAAQLTQVFLPHLREVGGTVIFVNSGSGLSTRSPLAAYGASKHALRAYADALRIEEPTIRVSSIFPGRVATDMQREVRALEFADYDERDYLRASTVAAVIATMLALPADGVLTDVTLRPRS